MYRAIARNKRTTVFLIAGYIVVVVGVGVGLSFLINSIWPVIFLSAFAALHVLWAWFRAYKEIERSMNSQRVTRREEPRLFHVVETLAIRNGMPMPVVKVEEVDGINAWASGMRADQSIVGATRGALNKLDNTELEAVMAHEMSHIKNGDIRVTVLIMALVQFMQMIAFILFAIAAGAGQSNNRSKKNKKSGSGAGVIAVLALALGFVFMIVGYIIGPIVQSAVSRQREYLADASGVEMTRFSPGFIGLFRKLEDEEFGGAQGAADGAMGAFYTYRRPRRGLGYIFNATHPPTWKRIERMEKMADAM